MSNANETVDTEAGLREWSKDYDACINNPPKDGDILTAPSIDTLPALVVELQEGKPPFIYGRAYVPEIAGAPLGWFLQSDPEESFHGWMCILLPRARTDLIRKYGLQNQTIRVKSLKMIRQSQSGKALLCEIHEYADEADQPTSKLTVEAVCVTPPEDEPIIDPEIDLTGND